VSWVWGEAAKKKRMGMNEELNELNENSLYQVCV
jgi:hypothetical protein